ncbi:MAG: nucleoside monophosphate kinase [Candidatus Falkowbacteria bacterium]
MPNYYIFFGAPGSGKGTQVVQLAERLLLPVISTGDLLRQETEAGSDLGKRVQAVMASGQLVDDQTVAELVRNRLLLPDAVSGAIFDGYPRRLSQQEYLLAIISPLVGTGKIVPILIDVSDTEVESRLSGRRACLCGATYHLKYKVPQQENICDICGQTLFQREDDKPEVINERLQVYHEQVEPVLTYWRDQNKLITINGEQPIDSVTRELFGKIEQ